jgi:hypothetical protein
VKYFTLDGWIGDQDLDDDGAAARGAVQAYKAYLASVQPALPVDFKRLLAAFCIHDARLRHMAVDLPAGMIVLRFDAGDITMREARDISLHYGGAVFVESTADPDRGLPGPHGYGDLGNDEIEVLDGGLLEHRLLFSTGVELTLRFRAFRIEEHTMPERPAEQ